MDSFTDEIPEAFRGASDVSFCRFPYSYTSPYAAMWQVSGSCDISLGRCLSLRWCNASQCWELCTIDPGVAMYAVSLVAFRRYGGSLLNV